MYSTLTKKQCFDLFFTTGCLLHPIITLSMAMERLKLICANMLCSYISDARMAITTLDLADKHGCPRLREACKKFLMDHFSLDGAKALLSLFYSKCYYCIIFFWRFIINSIYACSSMHLLSHFETFCNQLLYNIYQCYVRQGRCLIYFILYLLVLVYLM